MSTNPYNKYIAVGYGKQIIGTCDELAKIFNVSKQQIYNSCHTNMPLKHEGKKYYIDVLLE